MFVAVKSYGLLANAFLNQTRLGSYFLIGSVFNGRILTSIDPQWVTHLVPLGYFALNP